MKVKSKIRAGHAPNGKTFFVMGEEKTFSYRDLGRCDREFVDAMISAKLVEVIEDDLPAVVIPFPQPTPPAPPESKPVKIRKARAT